MYPADYYFNSLPKKKNKLVVQTCRCGNHTYQKEGVCVPCKIHLPELLKDARG